MTRDVACLEKIQESFIGLIDLCRETDEGLTHTTVSDLLSDLILLYRSEFLPVLDDAEDRQNEVFGFKKRPPAF